MFERTDWSLFRNLNTLSQKAGVALRDMAGLVLKELMDNALDAAVGKKPRFGDLPGGWMFIEDDGPGIPGEAEEVASLFSIRRPLTSTKILRRPSRGALGNGTRVIAGSILASGGELRVATRGLMLHLKLHDDGTTTIAHHEPSKVQGTRVELRFGTTLPRTENVWRLARIAAAFNYAATYTGRTSAWWYDSDSFYELLQAAGSTNMLELVKLFDHVGPKQSSSIALLGMQKAADVSRDDSERLLGHLRGFGKEVSPRKIGCMVSEEEAAGGTLHYARHPGILDVRPGRGHIAARLPYLIEVTFFEQKHADDEDELITFINGTPITSEMSVERRNKSEVAIFGCGLSHRFKRFPRMHVKMWLNVTTPHMPITTDGKEPDLARFHEEIQDTIRKAGKHLRASIRKAAGSKVDKIRDCLDEAVEKASGSGQYRFSLRQLFYAVRPYVLEGASTEDDGSLDYNYFTRWISEYENKQGEIKGMYRDARGTLYHPHTGETIPIGTIAVEEYKRPKWGFRNVLYIEKEGLFEVLKQEGFPERYDCALLSSKGFASRAVRDLIDLLGNTREEINVYAIHDADGPGTLIYEALVNETVARRARTIKVHNLGMEPWEGVALGLQVERFKDRRSKVPVADYIKGDHRRGTNWEEWLQSQRVELNAMTSPAFVAWIEGKFEKLGVKKVMPPIETLQARLEADVEAVIRDRLTEQLLNEGGLERLVEERMEKLRPEVAGTLIMARVHDELESKPAEQWSQPITRIARQLVTANTPLPTTPLPRQRRKA